MDYAKLVNRLFGRTPVRVTPAGLVESTSVGGLALESAREQLADLGDSAVAVAELPGQQFAAIGSTHCMLLTGGAAEIARIVLKEGEDDPTSTVRDLTPVEKKNAREHVIRGRALYRFGRFKPGMRVKWNGESWLVYDARARGGSKFTLMLVSPDYARLADEVPPAEIGEQPEESIVESFSQAQLDQLRQEYGTLTKIDPTGPAYKKLIGLLDKMDQKTLKLVAGANIKFVSMLARNRVKKDEGVQRFDSLRDFLDATHASNVTYPPKGSAFWKVWLGEFGTVNESIDEGKLAHGTTVRITYKNPRTPIQKAFDGKVGNISGEEKDGQTTMYRVMFRPPVKVPGVGDVTSDLWAREFLTPVHEQWDALRVAVLAEGIEFIDRYTALGIPHPDPATMCLGPCEGTGVVPVQADDEDEELRRRWDVAEAKSPSDDGWHFVVCPDCEGSCLREALKKSLRPGTKVRTNAGVRRTGVVVKPFAFDKSNDGSYSKKPDQVPVQWDDGTKGWQSQRYLDVVESKREPMDRGDARPGDHVIVIGPVRGKGKRGKIRSVAPSGAFATVRFSDDEESSYHLSDLSLVDPTDESVAEEGSHWRTTKSGHKIFIDENWRMAAGFAHKGKTVVVLRDGDTYGFTINGRMVQSDLTSQKDAMIAAKKHIEQMAESRVTFVQQQARDIEPADLIRWQGRDLSVEDVQTVGRTVRVSVRHEGQDLPAITFDLDDSVLLAPEGAQLVDESMPRMQPGDVWNLRYAASPGSEPDAVLFVMELQKNGQPKGVTYYIERDAAVKQSFAGFHGVFTKSDRKTFIDEFGDRAMKKVAKGLGESIDEAAAEKPPKSPFAKQDWDQVVAKGRGSYTIQVWRMQRSKWGYSTTNPQGGGFSTSTEIRNAMAVVRAAVAKTKDVPPKIWVVVGASKPTDPFNPFEVASAFWFDTASGQPVSESSVDEATAGAMAAGGVVVNSRGRILLRKPAGAYGGYVWTFPKGRPDPGETLQKAAVREVEEESGFRCRVIGRIGSYRGDVTQTVMFLMVPVAKTMISDGETEAVAWVKPERAVHLLSQSQTPRGRARDLQILADTVDMLGELPAGDSIASQLKAMLAKIDSGQDFFGSGVDEARRTTQAWQVWPKGEVASKSNPNYQIVYAKSAKDALAQARERNPKVDPKTWNIEVAYRSESVDEAKASSALGYYVKLEATVIRKTKNLPNTAPVLLQLMQMLGQVREAIRGNESKVGDEAVRIFIDATSKAGFLANFGAPLTQLQKYPGVNYDPYGGKLSFSGKAESVDEATYYLIKRDSDGKFLDGTEWVGEDPGFGFRDIQVARKAASDAKIRGKLRGSFTIVRMDDDQDESVEEMAKLSARGRKPLMRASKEAETPNDEAISWSRTTRAWMSDGNVLEKRDVMFRAMGSTPAAKHSYGWKQAGKIKAALMTDKAELLKAMESSRDKLKASGWTIEEFNTPE